MLISNQKACAVRDDTVDSDEPVLKTICKVGSGLDKNTIDILSKDSHSFYHFSDPLPKWLNFTLKKKPDRLIPFSNAPIVQIRGSQITFSPESLSFDVRFPRFIEIRNDKSIENMTTLTQVSEMAKRPNGMMQSTSNSAELSQIRKKRKIGRAVLGGHQGADLKSIDRGNSRIFEGMTFWVVPSSAGYDPKNLYLDKDKIKKDLEEKIYTNGGSRVQGGKEDLDNFLIVADHITQRVKNHIDTGKYDIIKSSYILDSIEKKKKLPLYPKYMIFYKEDTKLESQKYADEFGDSYTEDVTDDDVKYVIFSLFKFKLLNNFISQLDTSLFLEEYRPGDVLNVRVKFNICASSIQERYLAEPLPSLIFSRCIFYLDVYEKIVVDSNFIRSEYMRCMNVEQVALCYSESHNVSKKVLTGSTFSVTPFKILNRSGTIMDRICDKVSHIIVPRDAPLDKVQTLNELLNYSQSSYSKRPYLVSQDWIDESIRLGTLQDELAFKFKT